jgi:glycosyltransferase involved in cell wall biosynthesis
MSTPFISVIVPNFNQRPEYLRAAIDSLLAQTFSDFEIIVSENHSTNNSEALLRTYTDPRMRIFKPPSHVPMAANFAFGADQATGSYIAFLPSDDLVEPDWLEKMVPLARANPEAVLLFGEVAGVGASAPDDIVYLNRKGEMANAVLSAKELFRLFLPLDRRSGWLVGGLVALPAYKAAGGIAGSGLALSCDLALGFELTKLGGAVYLNNLVGRHRIWGVAEGKVEGERSLRAVADVRKLFDIAESSPLLQGDEALVRSLKKAKKNKALQLSLVLLQNASVSNLSSADIKIVSQAIKAIDNGIFVSMLSMLSKMKTVRLMVARYKNQLLKIYNRVIANRLNS